MRFLVSLVVVAVVSVGCSNAQPSSPVPASASSTPSSSVSSPDVTPGATIGATPGPTAITSAGCPTHSPLAVVEYTAAVASDQGCFADGDVAIVGWAGKYPDGIGWSAPGIEPGWLALGIPTISDKCPKSQPECDDASISIHIDPDASIKWNQDDRWVVVTGHTNDPRAESCRPAQPDNGITKAEARKECREAFVLTSVRNATSALRANSFARVVIPEVNLRVKPSTSAAVATEGHSDAPPTKIRYGTASGVDSVYVFDGPVKADGYRWWRVSRTEYVLDISASGVPDVRPKPSYDDEYTGWVADGEGRNAWLIPENPCPAPPFDMAEVTLQATSWATRLSCFSGQTLTFRGWNDSGNAIFPVKRTWEGANVDRIDFRVDPPNLVIPAPGQWFEITGQFDHPSAASCPDEQLFLECRTMFTATQIVGLGP